MAYGKAYAWDIGLGHVIRQSRVRPADRDEPYQPEKGEQMKIRTLVSFALPMTILIAGCATIVGDAAQTVPLSTEPSGATFVITDETGKEVAQGTTPTTVTLQKGTGSYWGGKKYKVTFTLPGMEDQTVDVKASPNGWYIGGNFVFGGLIGWFIVDPLTGKMFTLYPKQVNAKFAQADANDGQPSLRFADIKDIPEALYPNLVRVK